MRKLAAALSLAMLTTLAPTAVSAPVFPVTMEVEYGLGDGARYDMEVTMEGDATFGDSDGDGGIWFYRRATNALLLRYEGDAEGFDLYGVRDGRCFSGSVLLDEVEIDLLGGGGI